MIPDHDSLPRIKSVLPIEITLTDLMDRVEAAGFRDELWVMLYLVAMQRRIGIRFSFECHMDELAFLAGSLEPGCRKVVDWLFESGYGVDRGNCRIALDPALMFSVVPRELRQVSKRFKRLRDRRGH